MKACNEVKAKTSTNANRQDVNSLTKQKNNKTGHN